MTPEEIKNYIKSISKEKDDQLYVIEKQYSSGYTSFGVCKRESLEVAIKKIEQELLKRNETKSESFLLTDKVFSRSPSLPGFYLEFYFQYFNDKNGIAENIDEEQDAFRFRAIQNDYIFIDGSILYKKELLTEKIK